MSPPHTSFRNAGCQQGAPPAKGAGAKKTALQPWVSEEREHDHCLWSQLWTHFSWRRTGCGPHTDHQWRTVCGGAWEGEEARDVHSILHGYCLDLCWATPEKAALLGKLAEVQTQSAPRKGTVLLYTQGVNLHQGSHLKQQTQPFPGSPWPGSLKEQGAHSYTLSQVTRPVSRGRSSESPERGLWPWRSPMDEYDFWK